MASESLPKVTKKITIGRVIMVLGLLVFLYKNYTFINIVNDVIIVINLVVVVVA